MTPGLPSKRLAVAVHDGFGPCRQVRNYGCADWLLDAETKLPNRLKCNEKSGAGLMPCKSQAKPTYICAGIWALVSVPLQHLCL